MEEILANHTFNDDKLFLANFIVTNYLGPDVFSEIPRRSVANRLSRRFPPYTSAHLGDSSLTVSQLKSLYYYALRNADPTLILSPAQFHAYLKGDETTYTTNFTTFFPLHLHKHKAYSPSSTHEVVKGIVVVIGNNDGDAPVDDELNRSYIDRFIRLSGSAGLKMDSKSCLTYPPRDDDDRDYDPRPVVLFRDGFKRRRVVISDGGDDDYDERDFPTAEELAARDATVVVNDKTVTFKLVGLSSDYVVIGISRAAYLFRVALPRLPNNFRMCTK
ncbi:unnamed protein product [Linum tenue]|uniref:Uncharacterized protein n=1 Tax=Linum tenue TaxID=586396 RepID=A0AAV0JAZ7_9ROSI|nr:unnamed protein product [Linum tenue]